MNTPKEQNEAADGQFRLTVLLGGLLVTNCTEELGFGTHKLEQQLCEIVRVGEELLI